MSNAQLELAALLVMRPFQVKVNVWQGSRMANLLFFILIALSPNIAAGFARLSFNPQYQGNGQTLVNSKGEFVNYLIAYRRHGGVCG